MPPPWITYTDDDLLVLARALALSYTNRDTNRDTNRAPYSITHNAPQPKQATPFMSG